MAIWSNDSCPTIYIHRTMQHHTKPCSCIYVGLCKSGTLYRDNFSRKNITLLDHSIPKPTKPYQTLTKPFRTIPYHIIQNQTKPFTLVFCDCGTRWWWKGRDPSGDRSTSSRPGKSQNWKLPGVMKIVESTTFKKLETKYLTLQSHWHHRVRLCGVNISTKLRPYDKILQHIQ